MTTKICACCGQPFQPRPKLRTTPTAPPLPANMHDAKPGSEKNFASSVEPVGEFWLRKFAKYMI